MIPVIQTVLLALVTTSLQITHSLAVPSLPTSSKSKSSSAAGPIVTSVSLGGQTFVNKGLVAFGFIPSDAVESTGDTIGGIGSAITVQAGSWVVNGDGTFDGAFIVHPDRGFNVDGTIDYQARQHLVSFTLNPYFSSNGTALPPLSFPDAQKTLQLTYTSTTLQFERNHSKTTGLDALSVRDKQKSSDVDKKVGQAVPDPKMPVPDASTAQGNRLSLDVEGIVQNDDGTFWISDEYGPYIYLYTATGDLIQTIQPPDAILPMDDDGNLNFTSVEDPTTGRGANKGFESLTLDFSSNTLYAMLQAATIQDGGNKKSTSRNTRLLAYDVSPSSITSKNGPKLVGEWIVPLPVDSSNKTIECSEIHFIGGSLKGKDSTFLALSRDGNGQGGDSTLSTYKQIDLFTISKATDISGSKYDDPSHSILNSNNVLDKGITPATYQGFVNMINATELARFGLHNGDPGDETLIAAKWESISLAPIMDPSAPNDFFLFTAADNDFITTNGISLGQPYNAGEDVDNQFMVFRVTLPGLTQKDLKKLLKK